MNIAYNDVYAYLRGIIEDINRKSPFIIAFDGRSASGKTTLAKLLNSDYDIQVVHTDDFYRPRNRFGELDLNEFSGNFDLLRFKKEIVDSLKSKKTVEYGVFDCKEGSIKEKITIADYDVVIVEGAYCLHPELGDYTDLKVFFDVCEHQQRLRIKERNGKNAFDMFEKIWIPCEERYINKYKIDNICDIVVNGGQ